MYKKTIPGAVLEQVSLNQLLDLGSEVFDQVIRTYLKNTAVEVDNLRDAVRSEATTEIGQIAHSLKSSSASVGAFKLSKLFADLESKPARSQSDLQSLFARLAEEFEHVQSALSEQLATQKKAA